MRRSDRGFTLIEVLVVLVIIALVGTTAVVGIRRLARTDLRQNALKLSGAIRYLFDRASATGKLHRLVVDFEQGRYWAEESDDRYYMPRERETDETRQREAEQIAKEEEEKKQRDEEIQAAGGNAAYDITRYQPQEFRAKRARFSAFKELAVRPVQIKGAKVASLFTPRLAEPQTTGRGYIYFFPLGSTEAAMLYLSDERRETIYTLQVHPLTGRVQVINRYVEPPVQEQVDDEGNRIERQ
jgi:type II secretion system protein H